MSASVNPDALPQLIGDFKPVDAWQTHINRLFYGLQGSRVREFYQTFATADYRLAHALAQDYVERVRTRDRTDRADTLIVHEWGVGNGNLAARFLSHLRALDRDGQIYPRLRYVLVDNQPVTLETARRHPGLAEHTNRVDVLHGDVT